MTASTLQAAARRLARASANDEARGARGIAWPARIDESAWCTPPELVTVAAEAGFRTVGIRLTATPSVGVPPYDILREGPLLRETLRRLADTGVSVLDTEFLRFEPEHPVGIPEGFLEVSARLGARHVLVMSAEPEESRTLERFGELCDRAAAYGLQVGLEFAIYMGLGGLLAAVAFWRIRRA